MSFDDGKTVHEYLHNTIVIIEAAGVTGFCVNTGVFNFIPNFHRDFTPFSSATRPLTLAVVPQLLAIQKLADIHKGTGMVCGDVMQDEYTEQLFAAMFVHPESRVLELGCNVGRSTLNLSRILRDSRNLVGLECSVHTDIWPRLVENLKMNGSHARVFNVALSSRKLIQQGWLTRVSDTLPEGWTKVPTLTWSELKATTNCLPFNTLVVDCEGALYQILIDFPDILNGIHTVIMENDYETIVQKQYVDKKLRGVGLLPVYSLSFPTPLPCALVFYEVWKTREGLGLSTEPQLVPF